MDLGLEQVTVEHGGVPALKGLSHHFPPGSRTQVVGPAGAGKTSLLKCLAGLLRPTSGAVRWDGQDAWGLEEAARARARQALGMVFQTDALFDSRPVLENVAFPLLRRGVPRPEALARARRMLQEVGLEGAGELGVEQLSGGMRKRVGLARALVAAPAVVLADDPLAGLDPATEARVLALLHGLAPGTTLVVASPRPLPLPGGQQLRLEEGQAAGAGP